MLNIMLSDKLPMLDNVIKHYEIPLDKIYFIAILHPVTTELELIENQLKSFQSPVIVERIT